MALACSRAASRPRGCQQRPSWRLALPVRLRCTRGRRSHLGDGRRCRGGCVGLGLHFGVGYAAQRRIFGFLRICGSWRARRRAGRGSLALGRSRCCGVVGLPWALRRGPRICSGLHSVYWLYSPSRVRWPIGRRSSDVPSLRPRARLKTCRRSLKQQTSFRTSRPMAASCSLKPCRA